MPQILEHGEIETVVHSHARWVHACACRRVRNEAMAEDVTQAVFILLWRNRGRLGKEVRVTGWLYRAVRYCAARAVRDKDVRERHEREAAMVRLRERSGDEAGWSEVSPELEAAVDRLGERYREAVLLRFYRQMSFVEVGKCLGISEDAAQKRVERAVEKLHEMLGKKGISGTTAGLSAALVGNVVGETPTSLVEGIMKAVGSGSGSSVAAGIAKGAMKMMTVAKVKVAAVIALVLVAGVGAGVAGMGVGATTQVTPPAEKPSANQASVPAKPLMQLQPGQVPSAAEVLDSVWANIARYRSWDVTYTAECYAADGSGQPVGRPKTVAKVKWRKQNGMVYAESVDAERGTQKVRSTATQTILLSTGGRDILPTATIIKDGSPDSVSGGTVETMVRGSELPPLKATAQMTVTRDAVTGNILLRDPRGPEILVVLEIDPARDWAIVKGESVIGGKTTMRVSASDFRRTKQGLWMPYRYSQQGGDLIMVYTVDSADVNIDVPAESMKLDIPVGTRVHDRIADKVYTEW